MLSTGGRGFLHVWLLPSFLPLWEGTVVGSSIPPPLVACFQWVPPASAGANK